MAELSDARIKKIRFRCWHRGTREMDLLLGRYADQFLADMSTQEVDELESLLELPDPLLFSLIQSPEIADQNELANLLAKIKSFHESLYSV